MFDDHEKFLTQVFTDLRIDKNTPKYNFFKEIVIEMMTKHNNMPIRLLDLYEKLVASEYNRLFNKCMAGNLTYKSQDVKRFSRRILSSL